jgi:hypothetical protein
MGDNPVRDLKTAANALCVVKPLSSARYLILYFLYSGFSFSLSMM